MYLSFTRPVQHILKRAYVFNDHATEIRVHNWLMPKLSKIGIISHGTLDPSLRPSRLKKICPQLLEHAANVSFGISQCKHMWRLRKSNCVSPGNFGNLNCAWPEPINTINVGSLRILFSKVCMLIETVFFILTGKVKGSIVLNPSQSNVMCVRIQFWSCLETHQNSTHNIRKLLSCPGRWHKTSQTL